MEEILSSIKRIIAEEGEGTTPRSRRARSAPAPVVAPQPDDDEILELSDPVPAPSRVPEPEVAAEAIVPPPAAATREPEREPEPEPELSRLEAIVSERALEATRGPLEALSRMVVKPDIPGSDTLEGVVREMLRPMLREWLDANLPQLVEAMVAREIARITGRR